MPGKMPLQADSQVCLAPYNSYCIHVHRFNIITFVYWEKWNIVCFCKGAKCTSSWTKIKNRNRKENTARLLVRNYQEQSACHAHNFGTQRIKAGQNKRMNAFIVSFSHNKAQTLSKYRVPLNYPFNSWSRAAVTYSTLSLFSISAKACFH